MKKIITILAVIAFSMSMTYASDWKIQLVENDYGYLEVQMKCINASLTPSSGDPLSGMTFQIIWPTSLSADIDLICTNNDYYITDANATGTSGIDTWRGYYMSSTPVSCPDTWTTGDWQSIVIFKVDVGSGTGDFAIAPNGTVGAGLNWQFGDPAITYNPDVIVGVSSYDYPTVVYDFVWTGSGTPTAFQNANSWSLSGNWVDECGDAVGAAPISSSNCFIPSGMANYPTNVYSGLLTGQTGALNNLKIESGGSIDWGISATSPETLDIGGNLDIYGTLTIKPDSYVTADNGDTYIDDATGLVIEADATGVGSFIDNGTITYGGSGTAKVQTYLTNS
ncbi:MAG: hypothetical protein QM503_13095, partial [Bacteroidota bacterium]